MLGLKLIHDKFTSDDHVKVNVIKTKSMAYGNVIPFDVKFDGEDIEQVHRYKYVGNITRSTKRYDGDIHSENYTYLCDVGMFKNVYDLANLRAPKISIQKYLTRTCVVYWYLPHPHPTPQTQLPPGKLAPKLTFHTFHMIVKPILTNASDAWGANKTGLTAIDKVFLRFVRCTLGMKATTSNTFVFGQCGRIPSKVACKISTMCYKNILHHMPDSSIVKKFIMRRISSRLYNLGHESEGTGSWLQCQYGDN